MKTYPHVYLAALVVWEFAKLYAAWHGLVGWFIFDCVAQAVMFWMFWRRVRIAQKLQVLETRLAGIERAERIAGHGLELAGIVDKILKKK